MSSILHPPRRVELPTPSRDVVRRRRALLMRSVARNLAPAAVRRDGAAFAAGLRRTFDNLGATFTKFGQLIASAPSLFGEEVAHEFRGCLDAGPLVPFATVRSIVETELGAPLEDRFAEFETTPLAAASIAVVHRAVLPDGRAVAVKVLRPEIEEVIAADVAVMRPFFEFAGAQLAVGIAGTLPGLLDGLEEQVSEELDLRNEADALRWFHAVVTVMGFERVRIPKVVAELSGRRVLTMDLIDGRPIDEAPAGLDLRDAIGEAVLSWFASALVHGAFHGDIHAGNLLALDDGSVAVLDWGIVGRLDADMHRFFRRMIEAVLGDESAWPEVRDHVIQAYGTGVQEIFGLDDDQMTHFVRMQIEPMLTRPFAEVDLRTLMGNNTDRPRGSAVGVRTKVGVWRTARRVQRQMLADGVRGSAFDRANFLLTKQLVYFDRYGKRYIPDQAIIWDPEVFQSLLALPAPAPAAA